MTTNSYDWYGIAYRDDTVEQGDMLKRVPLLQPEYSEDQSTTDDLSFTATQITLNVIVMTQSCDLADFRDDDLVILCPVYPLRVAQSAQGKSLANADSWGKLRKGAIIHAHLLNQCLIQGHEFEYQVVDLRKIYTIPLKAVKQFARNTVSRVRLLSPYREHLSQAFARQFMRIGLPIDLPQKFPYGN